MKKLFEELEMLSEHYFSTNPSYATSNRQILERRFWAFKFIKLGIHSVEENKKALELLERLMDISNSKHKNEKDEWLLKRLITKIMKFEAKEYPNL